MNSVAFISKAKKVVLENLLNPQFGVEMMAKELGISRSELYKRIKAAENKSASQFIREIKLEKALELLKTESYSIGEIAYMVGFNSPTYFSTSFKEYFGYSPSVSTDHHTQLPSVHSRMQKKPVPLVLGTIAILIAVFWSFSVYNASPKERENSLAVLKFDYLGVESDSSLLANIISENIASSLSNISAVNVIASTSSFQIEEKEDLSKIGTRLGVNYLVDGRLWRDNEQVKVAVKLIDAKKGYQLWANTYEEYYESFHEHQDQISELVAKELQIILLPENASGLSGKKSSSLEAFRLYAEAFKLGESRVDSSLSKAIDLLEQAVELDPSFAEAYAELSYLYGQWHYYGSIKKYDRDKMMAKNLNVAMELNPESPEVLLANADFDWKNRTSPEDSTSIVNSFRKVLDKDPFNHRANYRLYQVYSWLGKYNIAHEHLETTVRLDPLNTFYKTILARDLFWKRNERDKGFMIIEDILKVDPRPGAVYFKALMLADQTEANYLAAYKVIHKALEEQPYTYGYLYWGTQIAMDLDLLPLAKKYAQLIQIRFPENRYYTYEPALQICITEKRFEDALDLTRIWVNNKGLNNKIASANIARIHYLKGDKSKAEQLLLKNFADLFNNIASGEYSSSQFNKRDIGPIRTYIDILRAKGEGAKAQVFADFLCSYYKDFDKRIIWGNKFDQLDCHYLQKDMDSFLNAVREAYFQDANRLALYKDLKILNYPAVEDNTRYRQLFAEIETEVHRMRAEVVEYLKAEGDWDPAWDKDLAIN